MLYESSISGTFSKVRIIEEKSYKNQLKIAVVHHNDETKKNRVEFCTINFNKQFDMKAFEAEFNKAKEELIKEHDKIKASAGEKTEEKKEGE